MVLKRLESTGLRWWDPCFHENVSHEMTKTCIEDTELQACVHKRFIRICHF